MKNKIIFFDFDNTIFDNPEKEEGIKYWEEKTGLKYPHIGWWSKPESLDLSVFDIQPIQCIHNIIKLLTDDTITILLTNRMNKVEKEVKLVLDKHDIQLDHITFKTNNRTKGQRIEKFISDNDLYKTITEIDFYDDMVIHLDDSLYLIDLFPKIKFNFYLVDPKNNCFEKYEKYTITHLIIDELPKKKL